ncbi:hypothetical protein Avbf_12068 [Armadillidium vulgare]|nr:hypothetical protein Avbf_12068 [Armadillidium vulgare]
MARTMLGPRPAEEQKREWTEEQLRASSNVIGMQAGYNKGVVGEDDDDDDIDNDDHDDDTISPSTSSIHLSGVLECIGCIGVYWVYCEDKNLKYPLSEN